MLILKSFKTRVVVNFYFSLITSVLAIQHVDAQQPDQNTINKQAWFDYNASFKINNKLYYGGDLGYRVDTDQQGWNRIYFRPNISGYINSTFSYKAGVNLFATFYKTEYNTLELRPFQDLKVQWLDLGIGDLLSRFRLEERYTTGKDINQFEFRFRYTIGFTTTNYKIFSKKRVFYNHLMFEGFLPFGKSVNYDNYTDKYRAYFALGYVLNKKVHIELHYIWQYNRTNKTSNFEESQNILRLRVYHNFYGGKKKESLPE